MSQPQRSNYNNNPIVEYAHKIFEGFPVNDIPARYQQRVSNYLKSQKKEAIKEEDFLSAQKFEDKINEISLMQTEDSFEMAEIDKYEVLIQRLTNAQYELEDQRSKTNQLLEIFQIERENAIREFDEQQNQELILFDEQHSGEIPPKFRKFSPEYLNLRKREKFMVSSKRYVDAENLKTEADARELIERETQRKNYQEYTKNQRNNLMKKQNEQRLCFIEKWDSEWAALLPSADNEVQKYENAVRAIEAKISIASIDQQVGLDGTALPVANPSLMTTGRQSYRKVTGRTTTTSPTSRKDGNSLPPLAVRPVQADPLRSRLAYIRTKNYNKTREKVVQRHISRNKTNRAKSSIH